MPNRPPRIRQPFDPIDWAARNPRRLVGVAVGLVLLIWFFLGGPFYTVEPDEQGLVLTFGKHTNTVAPGFHMKWPWPIQSVRVPQITEVKRIEVGFKTIRPGPPPVYRDFRDDNALLDEAEMLTGDGNIVNLDLAVQFVIKDAVAWEFKVKEPEETLHDITEAAVRQVVGDHLIDELLTTGKTELQNEVREKVQELADLYEVGVSIRSVKFQDALPPRQVEQAFRDVETAKQEKERFKNEALAYQNQRTPEAEGEALRIIQEAQGTRAARIAVAEGEAERFTKLATEYAKAPEVTRERLLLETLEVVLPLVEKVVIDSDVAVIHLNQLGKEMTK